MKKIKLIAIFLLLTGILMPPALAQDQIFKKNDDVINCKIKEIGMDEVKYTLPDYPQDVFFTIDKIKITKVVFENGSEMEFKDEMTDPEMYEDQKKNAIKVDFLSPLTGNTTFSYERSLKPGRSIEGSLGIIGLGIDPDQVNQSGAFMKFGMKFIKSPDFYMRGMRYAHILKGSYFKPEIAFGYYTQESAHLEGDMGSSGSEKKNVFSGTVQLVLGKQWVMDDVFLVDFYGGIGYGFDNQSDGGYHYGYTVASDEVPLSFSMGLKIGFLFR
nr:hypothetical protein [Bacteroidota bacterium]